MNCTRPRGRQPRRLDDPGLSLIEVIVSVSILTIALVLTIGPTLSSLATLQGAKVIDLANSLAVGRVEQARQMSFDDVGVVGADPVGVFAASEMATSQGIEFELRTTVVWVGSNAEDAGFFGDGSDGVQGIADLGRNYKWIEVWVQPTNRTVEPIVFNTAIAPSFVPSGSDLTGIVTVEVQKFEPVGGSTSDLDWPSVVLLTETGGGQENPVSGSATESQRFDSLVPDPAGTPYRVRLGPTLADVEGSGWRIHPDDLRSFADQVFVSSGHAETMSVTVYKPVTVTVEGRSAVGSEYEPISRASLILGRDGSYAVFDDVDMVVPGTWFLDSFGGAPMLPGSYTLQIDAPGYTPFGVESIDVPSDYPSLLAQLELIRLDIAAANTAQMTFDVVGPDGQTLRGAVVNVSADEYGPVVQTTDSGGRARFNLPVGSTPTLTAQSPHGHAEWSQELSALTSPTTVDIVMSTPSTHGLIEFVSGQNGYFQYLPFGSGANWSEPVLPNDGGAASAALPANGLGNNWQVRKICWSSNQVIAEGTVNVVPGFAPVTWGAAEPACLP